MNMMKYSEVENKILEIQGLQVIIDSDVAELYGVSTKEVNQAVSRNLDKFPEGYIIELTEDEKKELVTNCDRFAKLKHASVQPKAFSERGLYMFATILKSPKATATTISIIDTFAKVRELNKLVATVQSLKENSNKQKSLIYRTGELISELIIPEEDDLSIQESETTLEIGFPFIRIKKTIKKSKN